MRTGSLLRTTLAIGIILLFIGTCGIPLGARVPEKALPTSRGNWRYVGGTGPGNYSRIQDAINDSNYGDTIFVYSGIYYEHIIIQRARITLLGEHRNTTFIDGNNSTGSNVEIYTDGITIKNFTIRNCKYEGFYAGVYIESHHIILTENNISKNKIGIYFSDYMGNTIISSNIIRDNQDGICFRDSNKNNVISNNTICSNYQGLTSDYYDNDNNTISGNDFYDNDVAIALSGNNNTITNNSIISNKGGIGLYYFSSNNVISNNKIFNNKNIGINIYKSKNNSISNNIITDGWRGIDNEFSDNNRFIKNLVVHTDGEGIMIAQSNGTLVVYNTFKKNYIGISVCDSKSNNISSNNFIHNFRDAISLSKGNTWQGNYWERPRILPKLIFGNIHTIQFDWHPAQEPNDI